MFVSEIIAGAIASSVSLQADALDFLGDSFNYAISLAVIGFGLTWRARAAFFKGLTMAALGLWVIGAAAELGNGNQSLVKTTRVGIASLTNPGQELTKLGAVIFPQDSY